MSNIRNMKFVCIDNWNRPIYKCIENGSLWKDINLGESIPSLYSCQNNIDGEPEIPIRHDLEIKFVDEYKVNKNKHDYMMLDRLRSDCEYYLGYGNRSKERLYYKNEKEHIEAMKKLYEKLPKKPQWLTYKQILEYEKLMVMN
jgi:hypothetical protein